MSRNSRVLLILTALLAALLPLGLGSTAYAESCGTLHAADVAYGAPLIRAKLTKDEPTSCYVLDLPEGTSVLLGTRSSLATVAVSSGATDLHCSGSDLGTCRLTGDGPFRLTANRGSFTTASLDLRVLALTPDAGCPGITESALGSADSPLNARVAGHDVTCASVSLRHTRHLVHASGSDADYLWTNLVAADGTDECWARSNGVCVTSKTGPHVLGLADHNSFSGGEAPLRVQLVDFDDVASCPDISGSWASEPADVPASGPDVSCRTLAGARSGDRYAVATGGTYASPDHDWLILGGSCELSSRLGCVLDGDGPFRLVSWGDQDYREVARQVGPDSDCPTAPVLAFGTSATDAHPGVGCRQLRVPAGHPFSVLPSERTLGYPWGGATVYDDTGQQVCSVEYDAHAGPAQCESDASEDFTLITDLFGADTQTFAYDLASTAGCTTPAFARRTHSTDFVPYEVACENLDKPAGTVVTTFRRAGDDLGSTGQYVDATGADACTPTGFESCTLSGTAPFRVLLGSDTATAQTVTLTAADLNGCGKTLGDGPASALDVDVTDTSALRCLHVPAVASGSKELLHLYRTAGTGTMSVSVVTDDGVACDSGTTDQSTLDMACPVPHQDYTLVVLGTPGTIRVARSTISDLGAPDSIVNWAPPAVAGAPRPGSTVHVRTGQWSSASGAITPGTGFSYRWILARHYVDRATRPGFIIPRDAAGRSLAVEVTAHNGSVKKIVRSASVIVARS